MFYSFVSTESLRRVSEFLIQIQFVLSSRFEFKSTSSRQASHKTVAWRRISLHPPHVLLASCSTHFHFPSQRAGGNTSVAILQKCEWFVFYSQLAPTSKTDNSINNCFFIHEMYCGQQQHLHEGGKPQVSHRLPR